jgi:hypothetical protein
MPDLGDLLEALADAAGLRNLPVSERTRGCVRVGFGVLLAALTLTGAWQMLRYPASLHFRLAGTALFVAIAAFGIFNIVLLRRWRWPGCLVLVALAGIFAVRILLGP